MAEPNGAADNIADNKGEQQEEDKKEETADDPPPPPLVLFVDLHCVGCAKKIEKSITRCRGVEEVQVDMKQNQVTVRGVVDPQALCSRIQRKTARTPKVLSPFPPPTDSPEPAVATEAIDGAINTMELKINMHCEACAQQLRRRILKMRGVMTAETELKTGTVVVTGTTNADRLVDDIHRRTGKLAQVVPPPSPPPAEKEEEKKDEEEKQTEEKPPPEVAVAAEGKKEEEGQEDVAPNLTPQAQEENNGGGTGSKETGGLHYKEFGDIQMLNMIAEDDIARRMMYWRQQLYFIDRLPPLQIFSDENPNACCIS